MPRTRFEPPTRKWLLSAHLFALLAAGLSAYLLTITLRGGAVPGCGGGGLLDCGHVLASRWSRWCELPVSGVATCHYLIALLMLGFTGGQTPLSQRRLAWTVLLIQAWLSLGAAGWFIFLQLRELEAICMWCMSAHTCGSVLALHVLSRAPLAWRSRTTAAADAAAPDAVEISGKRLRVTALLAVLGLAVLIGGQLGCAPRQHVVAQLGGAGDTDTGPGPQRKVTFLNGRLGLNPHESPTLGDPDAPHVIVDVFDYTCPHCRKLHHQLEKARARYGDQLAIVALVMPLDAQCNPLVTETEPMHDDACALAQTALAVWRADRSKFAEFHAWMLQGTTAPYARDAQARARELVGAAAFEAALADPWVAQQIQRNIKAYEVAGGGVIPKLLVRGVLIAGRPGDASELYEVLETELQIKPVQ